jgi:hypothetical protein
MGKRERRRMNGRTNRTARVSAPVNGAAHANGTAHVNGTAHTNGTAHVVAFRSRLDAARAAMPANGCVKCGSVFVVREPAFVHCRYCGNMARIPSGSLLEQELFELRSGLRLAS